MVLDPDSSTEHSPADPVVHRGRRRFLQTLGGSALALSVFSGGASADPTSSVADGPFSNTYTGKTVSTETVTDVTGGAGNADPGENSPRVISEELVLEEGDAEFESEAEGEMNTRVPVSEERYREMKEAAAVLGDVPDIGVVPGGSDIAIENEYEGLGFFDTRGVVPSDAQIATGPEKHVHPINSLWAILDKETGAFEFAATLDDWFRNVLANPDGTFFGTDGYIVFDPRARYDPVDGRFLVTCVEFDFSTGKGAFLLSVSDDSDPAGTWTNYRIPPRTNTGLVDYDTLGVGRDAVYLSQNLFTGEGFAGASLIVLDKADLYAGRDVSAFNFTDLRNPDGSLAFTLQPALQPDRGAGSSGPYYLVNSRFGEASELTLWEVTDPTGSPSLTNGPVRVATYRLPPNAPQPDSDSVIDTGDTRLLNAVYDTSDGTLFTAHATGLAGRAAVRWYELDPEFDVGPLNGRFEEFGTLANPRVNYFWPTVGTNGEDFLIAYNASGPADFPRFEVAGKSDGDVPNNLTAKTVVQPGESDYTLFGDEERWGDYNGVAVDPTDGSLWAVSQYSPDVDVPADPYNTRIANVTFED